MNSASVRNHEPSNYETLESGEGYLKLRKDNDLLVEFPEIEEGMIQSILGTFKIIRSHIKITREDDQTSLIEMKWE